MTCTVTDKCDAVCMKAAALQNKLLHFMVLSLKSQPTSSVSSFFSLTFQFADAHLLVWYSPHLVLFVCLFILHQSCFDYYCRDSELSYIGGIGFQSTPPLEGAGVFRVPEGDSPQNTEPPFIAWFELLVSQTRSLASIMLDFSCGAPNGGLVCSKVYLYYTR